MKLKYTYYKKGDMNWEFVKPILSVVVLILLVVGIVSLPEKAWVKIPEMLDKFKGKAPSLTEQQKKGLQDRYDAGLKHFNLGNKEGYLAAANAFETYVQNIDQIIALEKDPQKKQQLEQQKNDAQFKLAQSFQGLGEKYYGRAIQEYEKFIKWFPTDIKRSETKAQIAIMYEAIGDSQAANDIRDELLQSGNKVTAAKEAFKQGNYYATVIGDYGKALEYYQQGLNINDGSVPNLPDMPAYETLQNMVMVAAENKLYTDAAHYLDLLLEGGYKKEAEALLKKYPKIDSTE